MAAGGPWDPLALWHLNLLLPFLDTPASLSHQDPGLRSLPSLVPLKGLLLCLLRKICVPADFGLWWLWPNRICSSCTVGESPHPPAWRAVLPLGGLLLPGLRGSPFPRPGSTQQPVMRSSRLVRERQAYLHIGTLCPGAGAQTLLMRVLS